MAALGRQVSVGRRATAAFLLSMVLASGCASVAPGAAPAQHFEGRFVASISRGDSREAVSGRFVLATYPGRSTLDLSSPLGTTLARVETDAGGARLTAAQSDGTLATWLGENPDALVESVLGVSLPVSGLADWIVGRPVPGRPAQVFPATGATQRIEQDGWVIAISDRFADSGAPSRLTLDRTTGGSGNSAVQLRLAVDPPGAARAQDAVRQ